jgi:HEAT repeat protein
MKAMPTKNSTRPSRAAILLPAAGFLVLAQSLTANAAIQEAADDSWTSSIFSTYGITVLLVVVLGALFVYKKIQKRKEAQEFADAQPAKNRRQIEEVDYDPAASTVPAVTSAGGSDRRAPASEPLQVPEKVVEPAIPAFGAYRVDQEVGKLVLGKPHRSDVMSSRAPEDRRAIEASLIKALEADDVLADSYRRVQQALEEYGFVARQSATLLMGRDAWERSSAARTLGQMKSPASLPFLIEALHDGDSVVRNQAISSLALLKMPAAIGALLDIARRHSDIPATLLSDTLSACSVETLSFIDAPTQESGFSSVDRSASVSDSYERFVSFEELPPGDGDAELAKSLASLEGADEAARILVAQELALHPVQAAVSTLTSMVIEDSEPSVRAAAVASLGSIDHESVLGPVLIALSDESRIVRAAAARTLTSLHFDRADAYVRAMETADPDLLRKVARACVSTGIVAQAVDRLASEDRRQAYEAFSLFSLLARAQETQPIFDVIETHRDEEVSLCAVRVLNMAGQSEVVPKLRELAARESLSENVRTAVLEALYKLDQDQPPVDLNLTSDLNVTNDLNVSDNEPMFLHNSP